MTDRSISQIEPVLVAIDISKTRHEVLISAPGKKRRRRLTVRNQLEDFKRLVATLADYALPVRVAFEGQTMGLAATITALWPISSESLVSISNLSLR